MADHSIWLDRRKFYLRMDALGMTETRARRMLRVNRRLAWALWAVGLWWLTVSATVDDAVVRVVVVLVGLGLVACGCLWWDVVTALRGWIHARWERTESGSA